MNFKILVFALIIIPKFLFGQFEAGVLGAPSITHVRGLDNYIPYIGFIAGGYLKYDITEIFSLRTEISYDKKSSRDGNDAITFHAVDGTQIDKFKLDTYFKTNYLCSSILFRLYFEKKIRFYINAGPYFGILLKQSSVSYSTKGWEKNPYDDRKTWFGHDYTNQFNKFDFGICAGFGIEIPVTSRMNFSLEFRNNIGLININKNYLLSRNELYNYSGNFLFGLGYKIR